ncbi:MAG TPA: type I-B CRISPR-associated endonuclease Cas1b [Pyrinomonadaceae bacterium]|jgi:CRISPR-associated protein Cas1
MARHYYLTRSGRLRRKDNTLCFEPAADDKERDDAPVEQGDADLSSEVMGVSIPVGIGSAGEDAMGDLGLEPLATEDGLELLTDEEAASSEETAQPVRVSERRTIPVEDVDAVWVFREIDLNARVLVFLAQHKVPVHFFNYYGFYAGSFYPREYLHAGYLVVKQVRHYANRRLRLRIAREFIHAAMHNILRNLRYYGTRGVELQEQTEGVQAEMLRLEGVNTINELMACEGRARAAYYQGFARILRQDVEFTKRVRRPPDNIVNALVSFTNGLVYSAALTQIYRTQLDPTISFLHEPGARRFSLALDLAEVFKPILADRLIFRLLNNRQLGEKDFAQDLNCCYLNERGRKTVLKEWDARLARTIEHRRLRRKVSYERLMRLECYKLVKHLTNVEPYVGFRAWW